MRKIFVITGSRSEYGLLRPVLDALAAAAGLTTRVVVTGAHLLPGGALAEIRRDGFQLLFTRPVVPRRRDNYGMALTAGNVVHELARLFHTGKPDLVLLLGDRVEILAAAVAATYLNIPIAHLHGGDRSVGGHADDSVRHAISKLAHLHFAATRQSARRLLRLGEEPWRIFVVGAPGLDAIRAIRVTRKDRQIILSRLGIDPAEELLLVLYNPITTEAEASARKIETILEAIRITARPTVIIYPNQDAGSDTCIRIINRYRRLPFIRIVPNLEHARFVQLMKCAKVLVGNTSAGIIEAPSCGLPFIHVGKRQAGREQAGNVITVAENVHAIRTAIKRTLTDRRFIQKVRWNRSPYGDGHASRRIARVLRRIPLNQGLLQKKITY